jgi:hypothetical protein
LTGESFSAMKLNTLFDSPGCTGNHDTSICRAVKHQKTIRMVHDIYHASPKQRVVCQNHGGCGRVSYLERQNEMRLWFFS